MKSAIDLLITISTIILLGLSTASAQKMVVIEKFTNTSCGSCPGASVLLKEIVANNENVIWVSHYKNNGWFDNPLTNDQTAQLWQDISVPGNPLGMIDRTPVNNYLFVVSRDWEEKINEQLTETTDVSVNISHLEYDQGVRLLEFDVDVTFGAAVEEGDYRVTAMIVEDSVTGQSQNSYFNEVAGHPLEGRGDIIWNYAHPNVVRSILDDTWGTTDVIPTLPEIGNTYTQHYSYIAPDDYRVPHFKIVCMINKYTEGDLLDRQVLNANQVYLADELWQLTDTDNLTEDSKLIELYPNPANDLLYVNTSKILEAIDILDAKGQVIKSFSDMTSDDPISLLGVDAGIYFLRAEVDGQQIVEKFSVIK